MLLKLWVDISPEPSDHWPCGGSWSLLNCGTEDRGLSVLSSKGGREIKTLRFRKPIKAQNSQREKGKKERNRCLNI